MAVIPRNARRHLHLQKRPAPLCYAWGIQSSGHRADWFVAHRGAAVVALGILTFATAWVPGQGRSYGDSLNPHQHRYKLSACERQMLASPDQKNSLPDPETR